MIAFLHGDVHRIDTGLILLVGGVGYRVFVPEQVVREVVVGQELKLFIHHVVREDVSDLYGFRASEDLELFEDLISVSGVGPKTALAALTVAGGNKLRQAIAHGDASVLRHVSGIGPKTAQRLVIELRDKVGIVGPEEGQIGSTLVVDEEVVQALVGLGYASHQAREAVNQLPVEMTDITSRIKAALKMLSR